MQDLAALIGNEKGAVVEVSRRFVKHAEFQKNLESVRVSESTDAKKTKAAK